jgi:hypothetical protein
MLVVGITWDSWRFLRNTTRCLPLSTVKRQSTTKHVTQNSTAKSTQCSPRVIGIRHKQIGMPGEGDYRYDLIYSTLNLPLQSEPKNYWYLGIVTLTYAHPIRFAS